MPTLKEAAARAAHEANRVLCSSQGDESQPIWDDAPAWQKESARKGVAGIASGKITKHSESHDSWLAQKEEEGWVYGAVKDPVQKIHPCMVSYNELPQEQKIKDAMFFAVVKAVLGIS